VKALALRALLVALCVLVAPQLVAAADAGKPTLIYLSAKDCPTCRGWERKYQPPFEKSAARKKIVWREVSVATVWHINRKAEWPADLEWLRKQVPESATPRFYLIRGDHLLVKGDGVSGWTDAILPALAKLPAG
jgi:hypothetical protein